MALFKLLQILLEVNMVKLDEEGYMSAEEDIGVNIATFKAIKEQVIPLMQKECYCEGNKTIYGPRSQTELCLIIGGGISRKYPSYDFTLDAIRYLYSGYQLIGNNQDLQILAHLVLKKAVYEVQKYQTDLLLPDEMKEEVVAFAKKIEQELPSITPVDYFYTSTGNFEPFDKMKFEKKDKMTLLLTSSKGNQEVTVDFTNLKREP